MAVAVFAVLCVVQYRTATRLQEENALLRHQLEDVRLASSRTSGESEDANKLTQAQFSELLRLRAEVMQLREQTNAIAKLREENEKLQTRGSVSTNATEQAATALPLGGDILDKESWAFTGYGTPERAMQSLLWAFSQTNKEAFLAGVDSNSPTYSEIFNDTNFVRHASDESTKIKNFRFTTPTETFGDFSMVSIYLEGSQPGDKGEAQDVLFKKNGDSWQIVGAGKGVNHAGTSSSQP